MNRFSALPMFAAMLVGGCVATAVRHDAAALAHAPPATAAGAAANDNLNAVAWAQTAVEHDLIYREVFRSAGEKLQKALGDRTWDALPRGERRNDARHLKPAVIVDIDETMLDNSPYQARLVAAGTSFDEFTWAQWCREKAARALRGALEFARLAARHGVTMFYLSNRAEDLDEVTLANLRADGFPIASGESVFLGLGRVVDGCEQVGSEKGCRREWVGRRYRVLLQVGDQLGDFVEVPANTRQGRRAAIAPYQDWIGERWFVLPNPTYGAWEPALFDNDWSRPQQQRRAAKIGALNR